MTRDKGFDFLNMNMTINHFYTHAYHKPACDTAQIHRLKERAVCILSFESGNAKQTSDVLQSSSQLQTTQNNKMITNEEAKAKALSHAKLDADKVTFVQCKLEHEDLHPCSRLISKPSFL